MLFFVHLFVLPWLVEHSLVRWYQQCVTVHHLPKCMSCHKTIVVITARAHCLHDSIYIIPSCFCKIWALCVSWITYDYLYYALCLASWALFDSLVPAMSNCTSWAEIHEMQQRHCSDNQESNCFHDSIYTTPILLL